MPLKTPNSIPEIRQEQAMQLFAGTPWSASMGLINGVIVYYVLDGVAPDGYPLYWFVLLLLITLLRLLLFIFYKKSKPSNITILSWHRFFAFSILASGCTWGLLSILLFPDDSVLHQAFIAFVIAGMTAGAVSTLSAYWIHAVLFIIPALLPLIFRFINIDSPVSAAMGLMVGLYTLILLSSVQRLYKSSLQNITLRLDASSRDEQLSHFKSTLDQTLDCVFMFDSDSLHFFYANQGALDQIGFSREELLKMHPYDIKPEYNRETFIQFIRSLVTGDIPAITFETLHQHKDGHTLPVEIFLQYIQPEKEKPRFVAIVRDITERKRLDRIKDEFVSTVSHELRTPLTSLQGSLGLISGGAVGSVNEKQHSLLDIAQQNTERLLILINDILDIQKIESGNLDFHFGNTDLIHLIQNSLVENLAYADKYQVHFKFTPPDIDCWINVDADRISQVMSNLLSNAAKFSPSGADVEIRIEHLNDYLRITVQDHGKGINPEFEAHVFEKFTQSDSTDQRLRGGTGLGLAISRSIVERHHGVIGFTTKLGEGTSFYVDLPVTG